MTLKKGNNRITFILVIACICLFVILLIYELLAHNFNLKSIMGNSVTTGFYYCEDASYTLDIDECVKTNTKSASVLGDVNGDGKVDETDSDTLKKYLAKTITLTDEQLVAADVNSDGIISVGDSENIRLYLNGHVSTGDFLSKIGSVSVCSKNYELKGNMCVEEVRVKAREAKYKRGDINLDGNIDSQDIKLLNKYLKKQTTLTTVQLNVADYNSNGIIDINDLNELESYLNEDGDSKIAVGDINLDGIVDSNDVILLDKYVGKQIKLTSEQLSFADVDESGIIDDKDISSLAKKISDFYQVGDINLDGTIDLKDLSLLQNAFNKVISFNKVQINLCDINGDGYFDNTDIIVLRSKVSSVKKYKIGDTNMDGNIEADDVSIIENYILEKTTLTIDQMTLADYNKDGKIDNTDANGLAKLIASNYEVGDINMDGKINMLDVRLLNSYLSKTKDFNTVQKLLADINKDGRINTNDLIR